TSAEAVSRSSASSRSRVRRAISVSWPVAAERRLSSGIAPFRVAALRRPALPVFAPAFERRFIDLPLPQDRHRSGWNWRPGSALIAVQQTQLPDVRFGSICEILAVSISLPLYPQ